LEWGGRKKNQSLGEEKEEEWDGVKRKGSLALSSKLKRRPAKRESTVRSQFENEGGQKKKNL